MSDEKMRQNKRAIPHEDDPATGAGKRTRTPNMLITIQLLYQLSYAGMATHIITDAAKFLKSILLAV